MRNFRKISALAAAVIMAFSAGCADKSITSEESSSQEQKSSAAAEATVAPETFGEKVTTTAATTTTAAPTTTTAAETTAAATVTAASTFPQTLPPDKDVEAGSGGTLRSALSGKSIGKINIMVQNQWQLDDVIGFYEQNGGEVTVDNVNESIFYDELAIRVVSGDSPDLTYCSFKPVSVKRWIYQPMDDFVDLDSDRWKGIKDVAISYVFDGGLYALPFRSYPTCYVCYDKKKIYDNALDDPYDLWKSGEWNMDAMIEMMEAYRASSGKKTALCGYITGGFAGANGTGFFTNSGGGVKFNGRDETLAAVMDKVGELYNKAGLIETSWVGSAEDAFFYGNLFYMIGEWAFSGPLAPGEEDDWGIVPAPSLDGKLLAVGCEPDCLSAVSGSPNKENIPAFLECAREPVINKSYIETERKEFAEENPTWSEEMLEVRNAVLTNEYKKIVDHYPYMTFGTDKEDISGVCSLWYKDFDSWEDMLKVYGKDLEAGI